MAEVEDPIITPTCEGDMTQVRRRVLDPVHPSRVSESSRRRQWGSTVADEEVKTNLTEGGLFEKVSTNQSEDR